MGVAARPGALSPACRTRLVSRRAEVGALRPRLPSVAKALSGCFSNQHGQKPLRVEVLDSKRRIHRAFARPAARRRDRRQVAPNSHCRPTSLRRVGTTQHQASGSHTPAIIDSFTGTVVAALFLPEASHAESHESRQEPASFARKTRRGACKDCAYAAAREDRARAVRAAREDRARAAPQTVARSRLARRRSRNGGLFSGPSREIELEP